MATATQTLLTAEEFARLPDPPDGSQQELVRGVIVTMPPAQGRHGECCLTIGSALRLFVKSRKLGRVVSNDTGFLLERSPDTVRAPDVAFWKHDRLPTMPNTYIPIPPDLAVEVLSPSDRPLQIQTKVTAYQGCGVPLIWVIDPEDRGVGIYRLGQPTRVLTEQEILDGEDIVPGFCIPVLELFED